MGGIRRPSSIQDGSSSRATPADARGPFCAVRCAARDSQRARHHSVSASPGTKPTTDHRDSTNSCPYTVWPAMPPPTDNETIPGPTGWEASAGSSRTVQVPDDWIGTIWARTGCEFGASGSPDAPIGHCTTGDCRSGLLCATFNANAPASWAQWRVWKTRSGPPSLRRRCRQPGSGAVWYDGENDAVSSVFEDLIIAQ